MSAPGTPEINVKTEIDGDLDVGGHPRHARKRSRGRLADDMELKESETVGDDVNQRVDFDLTHVDDSSPPNINTLLAEVRSVTRRVATLEATAEAARCGCKCMCKVATSPTTTTARALAALAAPVCDASLPAQVSARTSSPHSLDTHQKYRIQFIYNLCNVA